MSASTGGARRNWSEPLRVVAVIAAALLIGFFITLMVSKEPVAAYTAFLTGPLPKITFENGALSIGGMNRFGNWLEESITLILLGLSISIVFKARQFSLGAEGQLFLGALAAGVVSLYVPGPNFMVIPLAFVAAGLTGYLWGLIPGTLKAYLQVDEIVSTLMFNVIAIQLYQLLLFQLLRDPTAGFIATVNFPDAAVLPLVIPGTRVTIALWLVLAAVGAVWFLMARTPFGFRLKMLGSNLKFAEYGGIDTRRVIVQSMAISGILAGLAGALLARNDPRYVLLTGLFYGYLRTGAQIMERSSDVTREVVLIIQAIIILLITAERLLPALQSLLRKRQTPVTVP
jgi:simple sugar transport system permease protein